MKYQVCAYAICKNEEQFVGRWIKHAREADVIVVTDTGSSDHTVSLLQSMGAKVYQHITDPFRFDESRNFCLDRIPPEIEICVSSDMDDVLLPGWCRKLEESWTAETTRGTYLYNWNFHEDGSPNVQYTHERIHTRHDYRWIYPTHEVLSYIGQKKEVRTFLKDVVYYHYPDVNKDRSLNLPLLELAIKENPNNARNLHYLGREYMYTKNWSRCIETLMRYLKPDVSDWDEERSASMRFIARAYSGLGNVYEQKKWLFQAMAEAPYLREPYVEAAMLAYTENDWPAVYFYATRALSIEKKTLGYVNETSAWNETPYDLAALACYHLGLTEKAIAFSQIAMQIAPSDTRLKNNHSFYEKALHQL